MKITFFCFTLVSCLFSVSVTWSQHSIQGTISDSDNIPVFGADVYIEQLHTGTTSDEEGHFELKNIPNGNHKLRISYLGFITKNLDISMTAEDVELNVLLEPSVLHMDEVILSAPFNKLQSENVMKIESKTIETLKKAGAPTLIQSISNMPGVSEIATGTGIGKPVIRGLSGNRVLVYTQGVRLENQQFGDEHGLGMSESGIESVEVIKGPASLLYGSDALGGVLYLNPERFAYQDETVVSLSQNFYSNTLGSNTSAGVKTSMEKLKFIVRGGFNTHADYKIPDGNRVTNTRFTEKDFKAGVGLNLDQFVTEFRYNYNKSKIGIPEEIGDQTTSRQTQLPYQNLTTHILSLHNHFYLDKSKFDLNLGYIANDRKEFEDMEEAALDMKLKTFSYDLKYNLPKMGRFETIAGIQGMIQENRNYGEEILIPDANIKDVGLLVTSTMAINEKNTVQGGIRFDHRDLLSYSYEKEDTGAPGQSYTIDGIDRNYSNFTFSMGHKALVFDKITSRINLASGFRAPNLAELTSYGVHEGTNRFEIGNPDLISEQNFQADLSLEYGNEHLEVFANGFFNKLNNYIFASPTAEFIDNYQVFRYVQSDSKLYGGEFGLHIHPHPFDWLHLESAYETVTGEQDNGDYLPRIPANKWTNTIRIELKGTEKFNEIYGSLSLNSFFEQNKVSTFESTSPGYQLVDLGMGANLSFKKTDLGIRFSLNNLLDETYISHLSRLKANMIPNPGRNVALGLDFKFL